MTTAANNATPATETQSAVVIERAATGSAFRPAPGSLWLVAVECRYNVIAVCISGKGFYIPGQEPCWCFDHVQEWIKEIIPPPRSFNTAIPSDHPEATCDDCGGSNVVWFAPSPLWNKVCRPHGEQDGGDPMLCPRCFILRCEAAGVRLAWSVAPETRNEKLCREAGQKDAR